MRLTLAAVCLIVLSLSVVLPALAAGEATVLAPVGPVGPLVLRMPDLVVKQVEVSRGGGEFPLYTFKVTVANVGGRACGATKTGIVFYALARTDQPMTTGLIGEANTPALAAGAQTVVTITRPTMYAQMYLFATADFPDVAHQLGAVRESSEGNNVLAVPLDTNASFPRTFN